ncbi:probable cytosolic oligopeptidase A [Ostrinia furnacalis]|uniref:probable cytosolic oligopeptidase A n=1 Tax=Ostrinia furnacalis TaxID=93504 RepID=UPI00103E9CE4|nr:probable cytosolic oligopeptidase A [Ostrinia furnacalis]
MALSFLRPNVIARHVKKQFYQNKRNAGYVVLIPEIGEDADKNILLSENGIPEFNDITIEKCIAAISKQSLDYENGVKQIEQSTPNCKNAFVEIFQPLEKLDAQLELTWGMAKTLYLGNSSLMPTKSYIQIHERAHKARSAKFNSVAIFQAAVQEKNRLKKLTDEEQRLLDKYVLEGKLNGLDIKGAKRERLNNLLSSLQKERNMFRDKVNIANKVFASTIEDGSILREFPESLVNAMSVGSDPYKGPWKVTLQPHIYEPFMQYCPDRELRWNTWQAYVQRCSNYVNKEIETSSNLEKIRSLRHEQANILGFDSFVDMSMETKMAGTVDNVYNVLDSLLECAKPMQEVEIELLQRFAKERGFDSKLAHWDIPYWQRKQKWSMYNFDEDKIREYFPLPRVITSLFNLCSTLFKIQIVERTNVQTWHKDVKFYDVFDSSSNSPVAGFYLDPYARQDEKIRIHDDAGWHISIRNKSSVTGTTPLSALIFNFQAPTKGTQSLLTFKEVGILFQRFGHSLRHLLTKANYSEVAGLSNVEWDAAEVCGQVMTHWLYDPHTIHAISGHYKTDEPLPDEIVKNLQNVRGHMSGYNLCSELYLSKLDLELHSKKTFWRDLVRDLWPQYHVLPFDKYNSHPLSFTKIFSEEWGAAYYCHLWSKMIAADIYSAFEEAKQGGADVVSVGKRYRDTFLAYGGSCHPSEVFRRFRGRDPSPHALLNNLGLSKKIVEE